MILSPHSNRAEPSSEVQPQTAAARTVEPQQIPQPRLQDLAVKAGFTPAQSKIMAAIAMAESAGKTDALNDDASTGDDSYGLWQINMIDKPNYKLGAERREKLGLTSNKDLYDPAVNVRAAKLIFEEQGFEAWSVYKSGAYKKFLK